MHPSEYGKTRETGRRPGQRPPGAARAEIEAARIEKAQHSSAEVLGDGLGERYRALPWVMEFTTLSRAMIYDLINRGLFPRPYRISANRVVWVQREVEASMRARVAEAAEIR